MILKKRNLNKTNLRNRLFLFPKMVSYSLFVIDNEKRRLVDSYSCLE